MLELEGRESRERTPELVRKVMMMMMMVMTMVMILMMMMTIMMTTMIMMMMMVRLEILLPLSSNAWLRHILMKISNGFKKDKEYKMIVSG